MAEGSLRSTWAASNWVWFVPELPKGPAICVGAGTSVLTEGLLLHASDVVRVTPEIAVRPGALEQGTAALAVVELASLSEAPAEADLFRVVHLALAPSGCACFSFMAGGGLVARGKAALQLQRVRRQLRAAGFRVIAHQYAVPDVTSPLAILPATRSGSILFEMLADFSPVAWLRLALARVGMHALLYRGHLMLCYS